MLSEAIKAPFLASDDLLVQPSTVGDLLPMVAVDQLEAERAELRLDPEVCLVRSSFTSFTCKALTQSLTA